MAARRNLSATCSSVHSVLAYFFSIASSLITVKALTDPANELPLHKVQPFIALGYDEDLVIPPSVSFDRLDIHGGWLKFAQRAAVCTSWRFHFIAPHMLYQANEFAAHSK
jgi:hypothetical protein